MTKISEKIEEKAQNVGDGGFLQSDLWREFQNSYGRQTFTFETVNVKANLIEFPLPFAGKYQYCPRGPLIEAGENLKQDLRDLVGFAKSKDANWLRIEPIDQRELNLIKSSVFQKLIKTRHDIQPKEIFVLDISKDTEKLLSEMKAKTRYNINVAKKKGVQVEVGGDEYIEEFLRLTKEMTQRQGIVSHPEQYYRHMLKTFPTEMLKIYVAKYQEKIIAAHLMLFNGKYATYLHGASSNESRNVMAPYLLQWQAIIDAKQQGCTNYDFGGVKVSKDNQDGKSWEGITKFKLGFSPETKPYIFPGTFDIVINPRAYGLYRGLQKAKLLLNKIRK
jgi:lipid II:glycine glycyltransferase (peptidoglycan interpeptide bridge formation enzyme)